MPRNAGNAGNQAHQLPQCEAIIDGGIRCPNPATHRRSHWALCWECRKRPAYRLEARVLTGGKIETAPTPRTEEG